MHLLVSCWHFNIFFLLSAVYSICACFLAVLRLISMVSIAVSFLIFSPILSQQTVVSLLRISTFCSFMGGVRRGWKLFCRTAGGLLGI